MNLSNKKIVILGAGIAGAASAYYLSRLNLNVEILVIDKLPPLSYTTSCSGENFREYWPQPMMNEFVARSIELMNGLSSDYDNSFNIKYSGYDFVTHQKNHSIFPFENSQTDIIERLEDNAKIKSIKPYLDDSIYAVEHIKNAGSIDVYALGSLFIKLAKANGVKFITDEVVNIRKNERFQLDLKSKQIIESDNLLLASGPFVNQHLKMMAYDLPIYNTKQRKFVFKDTQKLIPRDMPFTIYADKQFLAWEDEERQLINDDKDFHWLLNEFPAGLHIKPEGQDQIKMGWAFNTNKEEPQWSLFSNDQFADDQFVSIVLKGASRFIPALSYYAENNPPSMVHFAGYYTRTDDNLPVIGKLDEGLFTAGALAGYGTMAACATGELIAKIMTQNNTYENNNYGRFFSPLRFNDDDMMREISHYPSGQL